MPFADFPPLAAWRHQDSRDGFEVVFFAAADDGYEVEGHTAAVEEGEPWAVRYTITLDAHGNTTSARVRGRSRFGDHAVRLDAPSPGHWLVDSEPSPVLDGCLDVDLESSSCTNAFPVRRFGLAIGDHADAPAAYVRALDLGIERLEQSYRRIADAGTQQRFDYRSPAEDFACELVYDESGLVLEYAGIASRAL